MNSTNYLGDEKTAVQNQLISYAREEGAKYTTSSGQHIFVRLGWEYVSPEEALRLRGGNTKIVFKETFQNQLIKLNPGFMTEELAEELIKRLERVPPNIEGNLSAWEHLRGLKTVFVPGEKRERNVTFIDAENIDNNTFHVTDEFEFTNGTSTIRADVVFLINGIPVFLVETKAAHKLDGIAEAMDQIARYHRQAPEIMAITQIYAMTHVIHFYYSSTWNLSSKKLFSWKDETEGDYELLVKTFFDRQRVVKTITDYILFIREDDELKKVVLRPNQMRAVDKVIERAAEDKKRGLVWHTQGSGKTYTMIVAAKKIIENPSFENPTVVMLVDRNELETQLFGNLAAVGVEHVEVADSKRHLRELLKSDVRGLIVSMIHKFEDMQENINTRKNIFVLVDEAHRTTGGKLGNFLIGALPNATYIGFTGTPIDKTTYGKGTFVTFGKDDPPNGYLDKYGIAESIKDETTVELHYQLAPNDILVDKAILEKEFLFVAAAQGVSDVEVLNEILRRAVNLKEELKSKDRVQKVGKFVAGHFKEYIEPMGYKAFLVAVDREACALYKEELDKHLPPNYSQVVYSRGFNDPPELAKYHLSDEQEKQVRKEFRLPDTYPKILIVTEKLLTGFDAPILYCMYLDKPMRDHVLLQAIARVNRPFEDSMGRRKPAGFILDFVGIFESLEKALAFDSKDITDVVRDIELLKERFAELFEDARSRYLSIIKGKKNDKAVEAVLNHFMDEEKRQEYYGFFRQLQDIYEILSPDAFLRPYIHEFETLTRIYRILKEAFEPGIIVDKDLLKKTRGLIRERSAVDKGIKAGLEIYKINEETLAKIEQSKESDTEKVFNITKSIIKLITDEGPKEPFLIPIGDKAKDIADRFKLRQISTRLALEMLKRLIGDINISRKEWKASKMPIDVYSTYLLFKDYKIDGAEDKSWQLGKVLDEFPHWRKSLDQERHVKQELYKILINGGAPIDEAKMIVDKLMTLLKLEQI